MVENTKIKIKMITIQIPQKGHLNDDGMFICPQILKVLYVMFKCPHPIYIYIYMYQNFT